MKTGIALGGGAGLGWAHIGVFRAFEAEGVKVDMISGTSIGAIVGACIAAGIVDELEEVAREITLREMLTMGEFGFKKGGLIGAGKIEQKLRKHLNYKTFEELKLPFVAVAADVYSGDRVAMQDGDVVTAVRASSAIPGMLPPVATESLLLVDGGVVDPVPVQPLRDLGADFIIAVDLQGDYEGKSQRLGFDPAMKLPSLAAMKTARAGWSMALHSLTQANLKVDKPDVVITPRIGHIDMADFTRADELIALGKAAAYDVMDSIT
ncbi:patatin-like phospholipase family protein [Kordiimonas aquimaris]|uniref:patatin-like phospholipase family protein n=1 Tax=Kordiimonas aquimaris TaxID=707591 RepID=UPI0021CE282D|nr:patatin-like phospholipase family protein [Kordiimonas aquimaris]